MHGKPTEAQVKTLQDSLNSLQTIKTSGEGKLQQFMTLKKAKSDIEQTMDAGEFRPQDRQAVLNDLNSLGPQGGGGAEAYEEAAPNLLDCYGAPCLNRYFHRSQHKQFLRSPEQSCY